MVEEVAPPKESKLFDIPGFKEMLFEQLNGCEPNPFLTNRANIKPHPATGKGGVQYDKKKTWLVGHDKKYPSCTRCPRDQSSGRRQKVYPL